MASLAHVLLFATAGLRQNRVPFELHSDGLDFWEYLKRRPQQEAQFSAAMTAADVTGAGSLPCVKNVWDKSFLAGGLAQVCLSVWNVRSIPTTDQHPTV